LSLLAADLQQEDIMNKTQRRAVKRSLVPRFEGIVVELGDAGADSRAGLLIRAT
jgi:hypothetical protein